VGSLAPRQTPNLEDQGIPFLSGSSPLNCLAWEALPVAYATASIALGIRWPHKPHHYVKVGILLDIYLFKDLFLYLQNRKRGTTQVTVQRAQWVLSPKIRRPEHEANQPLVFRPSAAISMPPRSTSWRAHGQFNFVIFNYLLLLAHYFISRISLQHCNIATSTYNQHTNNSFINIGIQFMLI
jgi:hypothetical protein